MHSSFSRSVFWSLRWGRRSGRSARAQFLGQARTFTVVGAIVVWTFIGSTVQAMPAPGDEGPTDPAVSASTGSANFRIPIEVPPGPGGLAPRLALTYSSRNGDGPYGVGWDLPFGEIYCSTRFGVPDYANCQKFEFDGQLLTRDGTSNSYHSFIETFQQIEYMSGSQSWVVTNPNGTIQRYGVDADARVMVGSNVARWLLSEIQDPFGNTIFISYDDTIDPGTRYPSLVTYGAGATKAVGKRSVAFYFGEVRPDPIHDFMGGIEREITKRLTEIEVSSYGAPVRRYAFGYDGLDETGATFTYTTGRTRLGWVQQFGSDCAGAIGNCTNGLPRQEYVYTDSTDDGVTGQFSKLPQSPPYGLEGPSEDDWVVGLGGNLLREGVAVRIADVNGDGLPDLIEGGMKAGYENEFSGVDLTPTLKIKLNTGHGFVEDTTWTAAFRGLEVERPRADFMQIAVDQSNAGQDVLHLSRAGIVDQSVVYSTVTSPISATVPATPERPEALYSTDGDVTLWDPDAHATPGWIEGVGRLFFTDLNADGLADIIVSVELSGVDMVLDSNGVAIPPGSVQRQPGLVVRKVYRNNGVPDPVTGMIWEEDEELSRGLPPFEVVQFESEYGAEQKIPYGVGPDPSDPFFSTWRGLGTGDPNYVDEDSGRDIVKAASVHYALDETPCNSRGLYGSFQTAEGIVFDQAQVPDFCSNFVNLDPQFQDFNGDGFLDLMVLEMSDPEALHQGPYSEYPRGYLAPPLAVNSARSVVWVQKPNAAVGEPRWERAPQYDLPNVPFMSAGSGGTLASSTDGFLFAHSQPTLESAVLLQKNCPGNLTYGHSIPPWDFCAPLSFNINTGVRLHDLNRDGLTDVIWSLYDWESHANPLISEGVLLNTGSGWCSSTLYMAQQAGVEFQCDHAAMYYPPAPIDPGDPTDVYGPRGLAFRFQYNAAAQSGRLVDLNSDGFLDYTQAHVAPALTSYFHPGGQSWIFDPDRTTGSHWIRDERYDLDINFDLIAAEVDPEILGLAALDVNGDGAIDFIGNDLNSHGYSEYPPSEQNKDFPQTFISDASRSQHSDLIRHVRNGRGGEVSIKYQSAIAQRDSAITNPPGSAELEAEAMQHASDTFETLDGTTIADVIRWTTAPVVSEARIKGPNRAADPSAPLSGFGHPTRYRYAHPRFCAKSQSDLGFRVVERTRPAGEVITSKYYQTHGRAGKTAEVVVSEDGLDLHYYREVWETQEQPAQFLNRPAVPAIMAGTIDDRGVHVGRLALVQSRNLYGPDGGAESERSFHYADSYGYNFVEEIREERATSRLNIWRSPGSDSAYGIFGLVVEEKQFGHLNAAMADSDFISFTTTGYDRGRPASLTRQVKHRSEAGNGISESRSLTYDAFGNLGSETVQAAAGDQVTNFYYDGDVDPGGASWPGGGQNSHSIRVGVMDPAGGVVSSIPDPGTGAIVETGSTYADEPGSKVSLDAFGRPFESFVHDGTTWLKTSKSVYDDVAFAPPVVTRFEYPDSSADDQSAIWSSIVSDGFGGTWKEIGETEVGFVGTLTYHDPFARTVRKSLPVFCVYGECEGFDGSTEPIASLTEVDAIGRRIRTDTPYGFSVFEYFPVASQAMNGPWPAGQSTFDVVLEKNGKGDLIQRGMDGDRIGWVEECDNTVLPSTTDLSGMACTGSGGSGPATTYYAYEGTGELSAILDTRSNGSFADPDHYLQYRYDTVGRVVQIDDPALAGSGNSQTTYDPYGNILSVTNARGQARTRSYDTLNRLTAITTPTGETNYSVSYAANQRRPSGDSSDDYVRSVTLDSLGRLEKEHMQVRTNTGSQRSFYTDFSYDLVGRATEILYPARHYNVYGWQDTIVRYEYERGFLKQICDLGSGKDCATAAKKFVGDTTFNSLGQPTAMVFPIGPRAFSYDPTTQRLLQDSFTSSTYSYSRNYGSPDEVGNVVSITGSETGIPALDLNEAYAYDQRNRISQWTKEGTSYLYDYDDLGNLTTHGNEPQEYTDLTRPHAITRRDLTATVPTHYSYDDDGNVESIVGESSSQYFHFDSANQIVCLSQTSGTCGTRVAYDIGGKRVAEYPEGGTYRAYIGETFLYEDFGLNAKASVEVILAGKRIALKKYDPQVRGATAGVWALYIPPPSWIAGGVGCAGSLLIIWGLGNGSLVLVRRRPLRAAMAFGAAFSLLIPSITLAGGAGAADPPAYYWEISDPLGTGMVMIDANGNRVRHQVFTPFGGIYEETGAGLRTFYAGHRRDEGSGMYYMQARWYDPGSGRFLSVDPVVRSIGMPQSANPYSYAENNPVNGIDPSGTTYVNNTTDCGGGCTNVHLTQGSLAASSGDSVIGSATVTDSAGNVTTIQVTGNQFAKMSPAGQNAFLKGSGQSFGAVGDGTFEAGVESFSAGGVNTSAFTAGSVAPTAGDAANAAELVSLLKEIPTLVQDIETAESGPLSDAPDGPSGAAGKLGLMAATRLAIFRNTSAQNSLREDLSMTPINYDGVLLLGDKNSLRPPGEARDLSRLNNEIGIVERRGGLNQ